MRSRRTGPVRSFVLGVLGGVALGLLFAPAAGGTTRAALRREARRTTASAREMGDRVARAGERALREAGAIVDRLGRR